MEKQNKKRKEKENKEKIRGEKKGIGKVVPAFDKRGRSSGLNRKLVVYLYSNGLRCPLELQLTSRNFPITNCPQAIKISLKYLNAFMCG